MSDAARAKRELRARLLARRDALDPNFRANASARITEHLVSKLADRLTVASFFSVRKEVDVTELHRRLTAAGHHLAFPRVVGDPDMVFAACNRPEAMSPGTFGIPEPDGPPMRWDAFDAILVPAVAFDRDGARLGFGKGFYDVALARIREVRPDTLAIGVAYDFQLLDTPLPTFDHDQVVDLIITESGEHRPEA